jgi:hypothetical protein
MSSGPLRKLLPNPKHGFLQIKKGELMRPRARLFGFLFLVTLIWFFVLITAGVGYATLRPGDGLLPRTFNGWAHYPASSHLFLGQYQLDDFARGDVYASYTYPFMFVNFLLVAPFHFVGGLSYNVAANFLPHVYMLGLTTLLLFVAKNELSQIVTGNRFFLWLLACLSIGITITDPLPWLHSLRYATDDFHILSAASFCYLSIYVFRGTIPKTTLWVVGVFLALWSPTYIPAWILAGVFFNRSLIIERKWIWQVVGVTALAGFNLALPTLLCRWAGLTAGGSSFLYRSGLDGSRQYVTSIFQAIYAPADPRHWPILFYPLITVLIAIAFQYLFRRQPSFHPLRQAFFLLIPYATMAILLPQFTGIHPYATDQIMAIPSTFLISFWFLQKAFWERLTGPTFVGFVLVAGLILMTNLLIVAQNMLGLRYFVGALRFYFSFST